MVSAVLALHSTASGALLLIMEASLSCSGTMAVPFTLPSLSPASAPDLLFGERTELLSFTLTSVVVSLKFFGDADLLSLPSFFRFVASDLCSSNLDFLSLGFLFVTSLEACARINEVGLPSLLLTWLFVVVSPNFSSEVDLFSLALLFTTSLTFFDFLPPALLFVGIRIRISSTSAVQPKAALFPRARLPLATAEFLKVSALA